MALNNINYQPKMTQYLVSKRAFETRKLAVVDIGARYGGEQHWNAYGDQIVLIGFEPDETECRTLNEEFKAKGHRYFPAALHRDKGNRPFYVAEFNASSGFYQNDMAFWSRFPDKVNLRVKETVAMETTDFDSFAEAQRIEYVDFMKLDVEGAELDILEGSARFLRKGSLLGAAIEVRFFDCSKQPPFSEVDSFMRRMGFKLFDIETYRRAREALPEVQHYIGEPAKRGQVILADTLYLRDAVAEIETANNSWDDFSILKLASLFEVFGLPDCAIELLQVARKNNYLKNLDIRYLTDLLTPQFEGKNVTYDEYLQKIRAGERIIQNESFSVIGILSKDAKLIAAHYLPTPVKSLIKRTLLRNR